MASRTCRGFWELAAESRNESGFPWISCSKIGKSARSFCASSFLVSVMATSAIVDVSLGHAERGAGVAGLRHRHARVAPEADERGGALRVRVRDLAPTADRRALDRRD